MSSNLLASQRNIKKLNRLILNTGISQRITYVSDYPKKSKSLETLTDQEKFQISDFACFSNLWLTYKELSRTGGLAAGIDGFSYDDIDDISLNRMLSKLGKSLIAKTYLPEEFRETEIPKGNGRFRRLEISTILDRTVAKALYNFLKSFWKERLPTLGQANIDIFKRLEKKIQETGMTFLAVDDIRDCFPTTPLEPVLECHRQHITSEELFWLIEAVVRGHQGHARTTGLAQGSHYSPVALELLLHNRLDSLLLKENPDLHLYRYVDNINILCRDIDEGNQALLRCQEMLNPLGMQLKREDGDPIDLRNKNHGKSILGLIPVYQRNNQLNFLIPEQTYEHLSTNLMGISYSYSNPVKCAREIIRGWINAYGPAFTNSRSSSIGDKISEILYKHDIYEISSKEILEMGKKARNAWTKSQT